MVGGDFMDIREQIVESVQRLLLICSKKGKTYDFTAE